MDKVQKEIIIKKEKRKTRHMSILVLELSTRHRIATLNLY